MPFYVGPEIGIDDGSREDYNISGLIICETNRLGINVTLCLLHQTQIVLYTSK